MNANTGGAKIIQPKNTITIISRWAAKLHSDKVVREGKTDDNGDANENIRFGYVQKSWPLQANFYSTVFDETGRP
jgi:hypothetical protein